jgi:hypothetical protein
VWHITHPSVVDNSKIFLPPSHIKLGLIKMFVKAMDKESKGVYLFKAKISHNKRGQDE